MTIMLDKIAGMFPEKFFNHASTQAVGVGVLCYLGLKIHQYNPENKWYGYLGKAVVGVSAVAALHFSGILTDNKGNMKYWIPLPGLGGWGVSVSLSTFTELFTEKIPSVFNQIYGDVIG